MVSVDLTYTTTTVKLRGVIGMAKRDNKLYSMPTRHEGVCEGLIYYEPMQRKELMFVPEDDNFRKANGAADEFARYEDGIDIGGRRYSEENVWRKRNNDDLDNDPFKDEHHIWVARDPEQPVKYFAEDLDWVPPTAGELDEI